MLGSLSRYTLLCALLVATLASATVAAPRKGGNLRRLHEAFGTGAVFEPLTRAAAADPAMIEATKERLRQREARQQQQAPRQHLRRSEQVALQLCPGRLHACALPSGSYECLDVTQELNACGACPETGGVDCEAIPNAIDVSCASARCEIHSCADSFVPSFDKSRCVPSGTTKRRRGRRANFDP